MKKSGRHWREQSEEKWQPAFVLPMNVQIIIWTTENSTVVTLKEKNNSGENVLSGF